MFPACDGRKAEACATTAPPTCRFTSLPPPSQAGLTQTRQAAKSRKVQTLSSRATRPSTDCGEPGAVVHRDPRHVCARFFRQKPVVIITRTPFPARARAGRSLKGGDAVSVLQIQNQRCAFPPRGAADRARSTRGRAGDGTCHGRSCHQSSLDGRREKGVGRRGHVAIVRSRNPSTRTNASFSCASASHVGNVRPGASVGHPGRRSVKGRGPLLRPAAATACPACPSAGAPAADPMEDARHISHFWPRRSDRRSARQKFPGWATCRVDHDEIGPAALPILRTLSGH